MIYVRALKVRLVGHLLLVRVFPNGLRGEVLLSVRGNETIGLVVDCMGGCL